MKLKDPAVAAWFRERDRCPVCGAPPDGYFSDHQFLAWCIHGVMIVAGVVGTPLAWYYVGWWAGVAVIAAFFLVMHFGLVRNGYCPGHGA